jgi:Ni/Fe-hydrogenase subunit HybB-like protein
MAHGTISGLWLLAGWFGWHGLIGALLIPSMIFATLATAYTGFLFAQGLGRDLWQGPHAALHLIAQSGVAGAAVLLVVSAAFGVGLPEVPVLLGSVLFLSLLAHLTIVVFENLLSPSATRHHELAVQTIRRGAYARLFWGVVIGAGGVVPMALLALLFGGAHVVADAVTLTLLAILALAGSAAWEYIWVEAGQSVPLS